MKAATIVRKMRWRACELC
ncbi:hypothetical protein Mgra_00004339 [Meloidogyne graminicola]|uniref:Uncharacterized protein n=1 Tax=Meloidogyne graminicola TaxID=189291 RepID=A0A8S9ZRH5_9BILA|nr:hypothetical protein Mgra_00004339 [Meloidogyne graminicola]